MKKTPELLAPAGTLTMLDTALAFGANAIYAGQPRYSLRVRNNDFGDPGLLQCGMENVHAVGGRFYLVSNIYPHGAKLKTYLRDMAPVMALKPDALIMSDPGLMMMVRENWPDQSIHLSVQANTVNAATVKFWARNGVSRVILSRELSLDEIADIRQACPDIELEVFVHGALCIAYSGRCLLSGYLNHRDPNQGSCTNACRWDFKLSQGRVDPSGDVFLLEERERRAGSYNVIEEDEHGTYILNSKDLRAIEYVQQLVGMGIDSLKIEGRTKSPYYVARTCQAYRAAIDAAVAGVPLDQSWIESLDGLANRGYTNGFLERHQAAIDAADGRARAEDGRFQNYQRGTSESARSLYVGDVVAFDAGRGMAEVAVKNRFAVGDRLELVQPGGNRVIELTTMEQADGCPMVIAPGSGHRVWLPLPADSVGAFVARFVADGTVLPDGADPGCEGCF
jgi:U32 family peptidase